MLGDVEIRNSSYDDTGRVYFYHSLHESLNSVFTFGVCIWSVHTVSHVRNAYWSVFLNFSINEFVDDILLGKQSGLLHFGEQLLSGEIIKVEAVQNQSLFTVGSVGSYVYNMISLINLTSNCCSGAGLVVNVLAAHVGINVVEGKTRIDECQ